jgi:hypothetical protein
MQRPLIVLIVASLLTVPVVTLAQESYCTLDDEVWGNPHRSWNGVPVAVLIDSLITGGSPLVLGLAGRSLTFAQGSEPAIVAGLPASWKPVALPEELGDAVVDSACVLPHVLPSTGNGKLKNSLLGETIALSLNVRLSPGLADLPVCTVMTTVPARPGPDDLYGTADDTICAACDTMTIGLPEDVLAAISDSMGVPPTVGTILDFANIALAGEEIYGVALHDVWHGVKALNRAFKGCRFLVECVGDTVEGVPVMLKQAPPPQPTALDRSDVEDGMPRLAATSPNGDVASISFSMPEPARVRVTVYSVSGREVAVVMDDLVGAGLTSVDVPLDRGASLASGVYFVRATARGAESGSQYNLTGKMIIVR